MRGMTTVCKEEFSLRDRTPRRPQTGSQWEEEQEDREEQFHTVVPEN